ncbi:hypothetical protein [Chenggangzhangella methanolivorans]|uniref:Helix-turn-helix domain-containing protein n=2 Tax=Chenggangzhangella methanolivorans TaxID=1437009 RepID=A0A9E6RBM7_9HYPH|nr:hypothetical protein [Chenggangzhangella methanolivorans]QZO00885.1 hypothetical protein K6K41_04380 [Chenggangzhangella methanolivorans]
MSYRRISGADLAHGLKTASITPEQFAALYGVPAKRVDKWLTEKTEVPHAVALFVGLIADPLILEKALVITKYMVDPGAAPTADDAED